MLDPKEMQTGTTIEEILPCHRFRYAVAGASLHARIPRRGRVLDFACGNGYGTSMLADNMPECVIIGGDRNEEALAIAREHYARKNVAYRRMIFPFTEPPDDPKEPVVHWLDQVLVPDPRCFDAAVCFETLEHLDNDAMFLDELREVLVTNGILYLSAPTKALDVEKFRYHYRHYDPVELFKAVNAAGFVIKDVVGQVGTNIVAPVNAHHLFVVAEKQR